MAEKITLPETIIQKMLESGSPGTEYFTRADGQDADVVGVPDDMGVIYYQYTDDTRIDEHKGDAIHRLVITRNSDDKVFGAIYRTALYPDFNDYGDIFEETTTNSAETALVVFHELDVQVEVVRKVTYTRTI